MLSGLFCTTKGETWAPWLGGWLAGLSAAWIAFQVFEIGFAAIARGYGQYGYTRIFVGVDLSLAWIYVIPILMAIVYGRHPKFND